MVASGLAVDVSHSHQLNFEHLGFSALLYTFFARFKAELRLVFSLYFQFSTIKPETSDYLRINATVDSRQ